MSTVDSSVRPRRFDLIAFDWDGTLFDSTAAITRSIQAAVRDVGGTVPSDAQASYVIGMALMPALAHAAPDVPQDKYPELANRYRYHYLQQQEQVTLFDGVLPLLQALRERHHWLAVAYGAPGSEGFAPLGPLHVAQTVADLHAWLLAHA